MQPAKSAFEENGQATNVKLEFCGKDNSRALFDGYYGIHFWDSGKADCAIDDFGFSCEYLLETDDDGNFVINESPREIKMEIARKIRN